MIIGDVGRFSLSLGRATGHDSVVNTLGFPRFPLASVENLYNYFLFYPLNVPPTENQALGTNRQESQK